ncbi:putative eiotically up-regulated protein [Colletotrichum tanaceti]|uniref:Putative eiotically up-regulated protein n=1 Tax=Colletotrichum tanaceti TaxID=1306861 RepID=A0A4U6X7T3_9PEZI|nr:putative eiotically up-regulated protein [Colletotrichum tanaceti]TKW51093.1 putative eiotically up-regulated protein [Colletotrichum tanaceti]
MPAFTMLSSNIQTRRARVIVIAFLVIVSLLLFNSSHLGGGGDTAYLDPVDAGRLPPVTDLMSSTQQLPPLLGNQDEDIELLIDDDEPDIASDADADFWDSYRDQDDDAAAKKPPADCESFETWMRKRPGPASEGKRQFPLVRPRPECRTFRLPAMEALIERMKGVIKDPDLYRLLENAYPMTLDSMIKWRGFAKEKDKTTGETGETDQELTAEQISPYLPLLEAAVNAAGAMRLGTYSAEGKVQKSAWTFTGWTNRGSDSETLTNDGLSNPIRENGMVRTAFRPSDDACIFQFLVPANMMWAKYLESASEILARLEGDRARKLTAAMPRRHKNTQPMGTHRYPKI